MARFLVRRLIGMVLVLFTVSVIVFLIFNVIPNSAPAQRMAGKNATPELVKSIEGEWGFDDSLPTQYVTMMRKVFSGDLISYNNRLNVDEEIVEGIPATFSLCIGAAILWTLFGVLFGYLSAIRAGGLTDRLLTIAAVLGVSIPVFWLAALLLHFFTYEIELFPASGYVELASDPLEWAYHLVLPWITVAVLSVGFYSQVLRANMLDTMGADHVRTARAKGLGEGSVIRRHVLRNSLIPIVTLLGLDFGATLAGSAILTESLFSLGGIGQLTAEGAENLDLPVIMAVTLFGTFFVVLLNAVVDVVYAFLDPRVRLGESAQ